MADFRKNKPKYKECIMKDYTREQYEKDRPVIETREALEYWINALYGDSEHSFSDEVISGMTFSNLMSTLIACRNVVDDLYKPSKQTLDSDYQGPPASDPVKRKGFANMRRKQHDTPEAT